MPVLSKIVETLPAVDIGLLIMGGLVAAGAAGRWWRSGGHDPLRGSPIRLNRLDLLLVWLCLASLFVGPLLAIPLSHWIVREGVGQPMQDTLRTLWVSNLAQLVVVAVCLAVASRAFRAGLTGYGLGLQRPGRLVVGAILCWLVGHSLCTSVAFLTEKLLQIVAPEYHPPQHAVLDVLGTSVTDLWAKGLAVIGAMILAPVGEECLFRGILQSGFKRLTAGKWGSLRHRWVAISLSALLFGAMHLPATPQYVPALTVLGFLLGFLYERTGSLTLVILVHVLFNSKTLIWFALSGIGQG